MVTLAIASMTAIACPAVAQGSPRTTTATASQDVASGLTQRHSDPSLEHHRARGDPFEGFNRAMYKVFKLFDRLAYRPIAIAYRTVVPKVVRGGIRHALSNASEPIVFINDMLQLKPRHAVKTFGRFAINSTLGVGGLIDLAKTNGFKLPHRDNGFGNTLGHYGVGPGPYLFLPFIGPSDLRDVFSDGVDSTVLPYSIGFPFDRLEYQIPYSVVIGVDRRAEADDDLRALETGAIDPYATLRSAFLQRRAAAIADLRRGQKAIPESFEDPLVDPGAGDMTGSTAAEETRTNPKASLPADKTISDIQTGLSPVAMRGPEPVIPEESRP